MPIPESERSVPENWRYTAETRAQMLDHMKAFLARRGEFSLISYVDFSRLFSIGSHRLGTSIRELTDELERNGDVIMLEGRGKARLMLSAPFYEFVKANIPADVPDWRGRVVEMYYANRK